MWATGEGDTRDEFPSMKQAYEFVQALTFSYAAGQIENPRLTVWVDEGDGQGWRLYETLDLAELAHMRDGA
jgi:hypothetical protein